MKKLLLTTGLAIVTASGAFAQTATVTNDNTALTQRADGQMMPRYRAGNMEISVEEMIGKTVYIGRDGAMRADDRMLNDGVADAQDTWDTMGEIEDVLLTRDGEVRSVVVESGGFLGMGERGTEVSMNDLQIIRDNDTDGDYFVVYTGDRASLEGRDAYDRTAAEGTGLFGLTTFRNGGISDREARAADRAHNGQTAAANAPMTDTAVRPDNRRAMLTDEERRLEDRRFRDERMTYDEADRAALTADDLEGARVYGANDEWVGEIGALVLGNDGAIQQVVVDVGGWLGIGERPVALDLDRIDLRRDRDGGTVVGYVDFTEEELETMPEWQG